MPYNVNIKEKEDHLRVEISGEWIKGREVKEVIDSWSKVVDICRTKNINHILAVGKVAGHLTPLSAYNIANFPAKHGWRRNLKVAFVALGESWRSNLFGETVAENRGYTLKVFDNEQDAKTWLLES